MLDQEIVILAAAKAVATELQFDDLVGFIGYSEKQSSHFAEYNLTPAAGLSTKLCVDNRTDGGRNGAGGLVSGRGCATVC